MLTALGRRGSAASDVMSELIFHVRHRPGGLAHADLTVESNVIDRAIALGVGFLKRAQRRDGAWVDFRLPPGMSDEWMTAHTAFVLEGVPAAQGLTANAAQYLAQIGRGRRGWGYNHRVATDCDSSAQALMVLHRHGIKPATDIVNWLISAQNRSGGFPTYPPEPGTPVNGWNVDHPDVTLLVIHSLRRLRTGTSALQAAVAWLESTGEHVLTSYWWPSPSYAMWAQVRTSFSGPDAAARAAASLDPSCTAPESAMLIEAAAYGRRLTTKQAVEATARLLGEQFRDGSWPCSPCLRVTDPMVMSSSTTAPGKVYAGTRRIFSTAHAVSALNQVSKYLHIADRCSGLR